MGSNGCVPGKVMVVVALLMTAMLSIVSCGEGEGTDGRFATEGDAALTPSFQSPFLQTLTGDPWARTYGGNGIDLASSGERTGDGGFVLAGVTGSFGAGQFDLWVLKLDPEGRVVWQKAYGTSYLEQVRSVRVVEGGDYLVAGTIQQRGKDCWVLRLSGDGKVVWQGAYGGASSDETANSIFPTSDAGLMVVGETKVGRTTLAWLAKLDKSGSIVWQKRYGIPGSTISYSAESLVVTSDGGFILLGTIRRSASNQDIWIARLREDGGIAWQNAYGGEHAEYAYSFAPTASGSVLVAGSSSSFGAGETDAWLFEVQPDGAIGWQKAYGGPDRDSARSIHATRDGGWVVAGGTESFGAGGSDLWLMKITDAGTVLWQKSYGGLAEEGANSVDETASGYFLTGLARSFGVAQSDAWAVEVGTDGGVKFNELSGAYVGDTDAEVAGTSAVASATNASAASTTYTAVIPNITVMDTQAKIRQQAP